MKKCITTLCLVACLALAHQALAAPQTFGPDFARFSVDVPNGWTAKSNDGGCQITSGDGGSSLSIQVHKNGGKSATELAKAIGEQMGGKVVKMEENAPNQTNLYCELDGVRVAVMITVDGDQFVALTMAGSDTDTMQKIAASLADAK